MFGKHFIAAVLIGLAMLLGLIVAGGTTVVRAAVSQPAFFWPILALTAGLLFEGYRITRNGWQAAWTGVAALMVGLLISGLPVRGLEAGSINLYQFAGAFVIAYCVIFLALNRRRVTPYRSEGQAWLLSLCFVYWWVDLYRTEAIPGWLFCLAGLALVPVGMSGFHAFLRLALSETVRTWLSVWCVSVTLVLGADYVIAVLFPSLEWGSSETYDYPIRMLSFFLLGISSIYVVNDLRQVLEFIFWREHSKKEKRQIRRRHFLRFSKRQLPGWQAACCLAYAALVFGINMRYGVMPRITAIWFVIVSFPPLLGLLAGMGEKPRPAPPKPRRRGRKRSVRAPRIES